MMPKCLINLFIIWILSTHKVSYVNIQMAVYDSDNIENIDIDVEIDMIEKR